MRTVIPRFLAVLWLSFAVASACECVPPAPLFKLDHSDVVFRGTIVELRGSNHPANPLPSLSAAKDTGKIAVFQVTRVWKGEVAETFEMPAVEETSACVGFWPDHLKVGTELLIYASMTNGGYYTGICGYDQLASAAKDYKVLGPGKPPKKSQ